MPIPASHGLPQNAATLTNRRVISFILAKDKLIDNNTDLTSLAARVVSVWVPQGYWLIEWDVRLRANATPDYKWSMSLRDGRGVSTGVTWQDNIAGVAAGTAAQLHGYSESMSLALGAKAGTTTGAARVAGSGFMYARRGAAERYSITVAQNTLTASNPITVFRGSWIRATRIKIHANP